MSTGTAPDEDLAKFLHGLVLAPASLDACREAVTAIRRDYTPASPLALRELSDAATPGPWDSDEEFVHGQGLLIAQARGSIANEDSALIAAAVNAVRAAVAAGGTDNLRDRLDVLLLPAIPDPGMRLKAAVLAAAEVDRAEQAMWEKIEAGYQAYLDTDDIDALRDALTETMPDAVERARRLRADPMDDGPRESVRGGAR